MLLNLCASYICHYNHFCISQHSLLNLGMYNRHKRKNTEPQIPKLYRATWTKTHTQTDVSPHSTKCTKKICILSAVFIIFYDAVINIKTRVKTIQNKLNLKQLNEYKN